MSQNNVWNLKKYKDSLLGFFLCSVAMLLFCLLSENQFEQTSALVAGDGYELYMPAAVSFLRNLFSGQGIAYSWDLSFGMNAIGYYAAYGGGSPFHLLTLLYPAVSADTVVLMIMVCKAGLTGFFFTIFCKRVLQINGNMAAVFSVCYALCGFQVSINVMNYIWMDAVYMLPCILTGIVSFLKEGKWKGLVISYAYLFLCHFYMGYMVGFFSAMFFLLYFLLYPVEHRGKKLFSYVGIVCLAAGILAVILLPTAMEILTKTPPDATSDESLEVPLISLLGQFLYGIQWESDVKLPFLYSGLSVILLVPLFFLQKEIDRKEKLMLGICTLVMLISCVFLPFYVFWHGFDVPDGWYHRFAFIISFLMVGMACKAANILWNKENITKKQQAFWGLYGLGMAIISAILGKVCEDTIGSDLWLINGGLIAGWTVLFLILWIGKKKQLQLIPIFIAVLMVVEAVGNGCREHQIFQYAAERAVWDAEMKSATTLLQADTGFYRVQNANSILINADTLYGFNGISDFGTIENYKVRKALENLGAYTSPRSVYGYGLNPFTQMILNVKYLITTSGNDDLANAGATVGAYPRVLNLGFLVDAELEQFAFASEDVFENMNALASCMSGKELEVFSYIPEEEIQIEENGIHLGQSEDWYYLQGDADTDEVEQIIYKVPNEGKDAYAMFSAHNIGIKLDRPQFYEFINPRDFGYFGVKYSNRMEQWDDMLVCPIVMKKGVTRDYVTYKYASFAYAEEEQLDMFYEIVNQNQLEVVDYKNGYLHGIVTVPDQDKILFTSIPYDSGWSVKANLGEVEIIPLLDGAFLGLKFPATGDYELEFAYQAPGSRMGLVISIGSLLVLVILCILSNRKNHNDEWKEQTM